MAKEILHQTFHGSGTRDTLAVDSVLETNQYSVAYDLDAQTALLNQANDPYRKYYFNSDNLLTKITRFGNSKEYLTDSVSYDYTSRKASYYDLVNKQVYELVYDGRNNIESETLKRTSDQHVYQTFYYYYDASRNPFLVNMDEDDGLFACFHSSTVGLFWNKGARPLFSSINNVQSFKEVTPTEESNGLFEYQYRFGAAAVQFGTSSVIYYHYSKVSLSQ